MTLGALLLGATLCTGCSVTEVSPFDPNELADADTPLGMVIAAVTDSPVDPVEEYWIPIEPLTGLTELTLDEYLKVALPLNPTLDAMEARWQAAAARYPQVTQWHDPRFRYLSGPTFFGANDGTFLWRFQFQQKVPWFGKTAGRARKATAESQAAMFDVELSRLDAIESISSAFFDYAGLVDMQLLADQEVQLFDDYLNSLQASSSDDPQAQYQRHTHELARLEAHNRRDEIARALRMAVTQINVLVQRPPEAPVPPPRPGPMPLFSPDSGRLRQLASTERPDLSSARSRLFATDAAIDLAALEFYPDFELVSRIDTIWDSFIPKHEANLRPQFGFNVDIPIHRASKTAAVREAEARMRLQRAELRKLESQLDYDIRSACESLEHARRVLTRIPSMLAAAQGKATALERLAHTGSSKPGDLFEARRAVLNLRMKECEAFRNYRQRWIELERVVGCPLPHDRPSESSPQSGPELLPPITSQSVVEFHEEMPPPEG